MTRRRKRSIVFAGARSIGGGFKLFNHSVDRTVNHEFEAENQTGDIDDVYAPQVGWVPKGTQPSYRLTLFLKEWALIGSSAANEQLLRMMKTRMRLVKMW